MAIFADMLHSLRMFLNRPLAEDFSFRNQIWTSVQSGVYVFLFVYLFSGSSLIGHSRVGMLALFGLGCTVATLVANWLVPMALPRWYDEDRWTVGRHALHTLFVLFCISVVNQLVLLLTNNSYPSFWQMYYTVTIIGFFPISVGVFLAEQRRLKRNLAHARALNDQLIHITTPTSIPVTTSVSLPLAETHLSGPVVPPPAGPITLESDSGKERLSLQPDQLLYVESVGNYVEVHWLNGTQPQKTVLRSTLKDVADKLSGYPPFFRCHRAYLVNLSAIRHTDGNARGYQLTLAGAVDLVPVSRSYVEAFDGQIARVR